MRCCIAWALAVAVVGSASAAFWHDALTNGAAAVASKDFAKAIEIYTDGLNRSSTDDERARLLRERAWAFDLARQPERAEADFTAAIKLARSQFRVLRDRAHFYLVRGRLNEAMADFEAGERLAPGEADFAYGQGRVWSARQRYSEAIESYSRAIARNQDKALYWLWRAETKAQSKDYRAALADYEKALALGDLSGREIAQLRSGRGDTHLNLKLFQEAIADFDAVLAYNDKNVWALRVRGMALEQLGAPDRALADYEHALSLRPNDPLLKERVELLRNRVQR